MEKEELSAYEQDVISVLDEIKELFLIKNRAYNTQGPFENFTVGGQLLYGDTGFAGKFEALKAYVAKHISNLYTHNIKTPGLEESMRDIATYMIIAIVMKRQNDRLAVLRKEKENAD